MKTLCKSILLLALAGLPASLHAQNVEYSLPMTSFSVEVEAVREQFYCGPYAEYAEKLLGISAAKEDSQSLQITQLKLVPYLEPDPSVRCSIPSAYAGELLKFTSAGLISVSDAVVAKESLWRFPTNVERDFSDKGVTSALTSESSVLYTSSAADFSRVSVRQDVLVKKTPAQKAAEMAKKILEIRDVRYRITVGDTDATYSGEALGAAVEELTRLEKEYLSLFIGYTVRQKQSMTFTLVPNKDVKSQIYVAFRVSDSEGLLPSDNISGRPVVLEISYAPQNEPLPVGEPKKLKNMFAFQYRVPAVCTVKISDGLKLLMQARVPVYQLGEDKLYWISTK